jgi:2-dehydropantoate 2-reductase
MLYDLQRGRKTEIEAINGVVCEFGEKYSYSTPFNTRIVEIVHDIEDGKLTSSSRNIRLFDDLMRKKEYRI